MACRSCQAENVTEFGAEINIHFPPRRVWTSPPCSCSRSSWFV